MPPYLDTVTIYLSLIFYAAAFAIVKHPGFRFYVAGIALFWIVEHGICAAHHRIEKRQQQQTQQTPTP